MKSGMLLTCDGTNEGLKSGTEAKREDETETADEETEGCELGTKGGADGWMDLGPVACRCTGGDSALAKCKSLPG